MKARPAAIWIMLNVAALGTGWWWFARKPAAPAPAEAVPAAVSAQRAKQRSAANPATPVATQILYVTNQFRWSQIESGDYRKYIANLRAIGCPEQTIKDLIMTDIMKLYAQRRGDLQHNGREFKYWETNEKRALTRKQFAEREQQLAGIDKEIPGVLRELLGVNYERELGKYFTDTRDEERKLAFLSETKRAQALAAREATEGLREQIYESAKDGQLSAADREQLKGIEAKRVALLKQALSPEEFAQYELSTSPTAERLRAELIGFNPTEDEFRAIYELRKEHDEKSAASTDAAAKEADRVQLEQTLRAKLGTRADDYARALNPGFRDLVLFGEQNELPPAMAKSLHDMREAALSVRQSVLTDPQFPADKREVALQALREEIEKTMRSSLGEEVYPLFQKGPGQWINSLGNVLNFSTR